MHWKVMCLTLHFWWKGCLHFLGDIWLCGWQFFFFGGGGQCVDYVGKVSNILANQTNRKIRGDRSWTKLVELGSFQWEKLAFGCLDNKVYRNWPVYLNANVYAIHWTSRRVCSWTWYTTITLPKQWTKPNIYVVRCEPASAKIRPLGGSHIVAAILPVIQNVSNHKSTVLGRLQYGWPPTHLLAFNCQAWGLYYTNLSLYQDRVDEHHCHICCYQPVKWDAAENSMDLGH